MKEDSMTVPGSLVMFCQNCRKETSHSSKVDPERNIDRSMGTPAPYRLRTRKCMKCGNEVRTIETWLSHLNWHRKLMEEFVTTKNQLEEENSASKLQIESQEQKILFLQARIAQFEKEDQAKQERLEKIAQLAQPEQYLDFTILSPEEPTE